MPKFVTVFTLFFICTSFAQQQNDFQTRIEEIETAALKSVAIAPGLSQQVKKVVSQGCVALTPRAILVRQMIRGLEGQQTADVLINLSFRCNSAGTLNQSFIKNVSGIMQMRTAGNGGGEFKGSSLSLRRYTPVTVESLITPE